MKKVVKLSRQDLRNLVQEAVKPQKPHPQVKKDEADKIVSHLMSQDLSEDDSQLAETTGMGLTELRRIFYGTKWEKMLDQAIEICDAVIAAAPESEGFADDDDELS